MLFFLAPLVPLFAVLLKMLIVRLIVAFGLTIISFVGYVAALSKFKSYVEHAIRQMPADILNLLLIGGFGEGIGYLFGAFSFWVSMKALNKLAFLPVQS